MRTEIFLNEVNKNRIEDKIIDLIVEIFYQNKEQINKNEEDKKREEKKNELKRNYNDKIQLIKRNPKDKNKKFTELYLIKNKCGILIKKVSFENNDIKEY